VCSINGLRFAEYMAENFRQRRPIYAAPHCTMLGNGSKATKMISRADRSAISRAVAKAIAYHNTGKRRRARGSPPSKGGKAEPPARRRRVGCLGDTSGQAEMDAMANL
jgi:hypothetical protein